MVHPNQEPAVIAGQGTIALEVLEQVNVQPGPNSGLCSSQVGAQQKGGTRGARSTHASFLHRHPR